MGESASTGMVSGYHVGMVIAAFMTFVTLTCVMIIVFHAVMAIVHFMAFMLCGTTG